MTADPVTVAARRQTARDRLAEHLVAWGCPPDTADLRADVLLAVVEAAGWRLELPAPPPYRGPGSTEAGRARARVVFEHRPLDVDDAGWAVCACGTWRGPHTEHGTHITAMLAKVGGTAAPDRPANRPSSPVDKIDSLSGPHGPDSPHTSRDERGAR